MAFQQHDTNGLLYYTAQVLHRKGVTHGFSSRLGGVSQGALSSLNLGRSRNDNPLCVRENHRLFQRALGVRSPRVCMCQQVHSDTVRVVTEDDALSDLYDPIGYDADGIVTNRRGISLMIFYADCIPILLYDPVCQVIGAVHAGWRGTALGIVERAVAQMASNFGSQPKNILAAIGPGIGPCCFETHDDVPEAMVEALGPEAMPFLVPLPEGKFQVDLKGINRHRLLRSGLSSDHVSVCDVCTACNTDIFWSHRKLGEARGNQAALIQLL